MNKITLFLAGLLSAVFLVNVFAAQNVPFSTGPAPLQDYRAMTDNTMSSASQPPTHSSLASQPSPQPSIQTPSPQTDYRDSAGIDLSENAQLSQMTENNLVFEQQANARIQNLMQSNQAISVAIESIDQQINQLQQQMKKIAPTINHHSINTVNWFLYFMILAAFLLIFTAWVLVRYFKSLQSS